MKTKEQENQLLFIMRKIAYEFNEYGYPSEYSRLVTQLNKLLSAVDNEYVDQDKARIYFSL